MKQRYLEITYRKGKPLAAFSIFREIAGDKAARPNAKIAAC